MIDPVYLFPGDDNKFKLLLAIGVSVVGVLLLGCVYLLFKYRKLSKELDIEVVALLPGPALTHVMYGVMKDA